MSEYMPTMDEIKSWYAGAVGEYRCDTGMSEEEGEAAFDRAIAELDHTIDHSNGYYASAVDVEVIKGKPGRVVGGTKKGDEDR